MHLGLHCMKPGDWRCLCQQVTVICTRWGTAEWMSSRPTQKMDCLPFCIMFFSKAEGSSLITKCPILWLGLWVQQIWSLLQGLMWGYRQRVLEHGCGFHSIDCRHVVTGSVAHPLVTVSCFLGAWSWTLFSINGKGKECMLLYSLPYFGTGGFWNLL